MMRSKDDYGSMSSVFIRQLLEKELELNFATFKKFIAATTPTPTPGELRAIARDGSAALPPAYGSVPYTWKYKVVALVYEFQKGPADGDAKQIPPTGRLRAPFRSLPPVQLGWSLRPPL